MSLPKKELPVWLHAATHTKLKALADVKGISMGQYAAHWLEEAIERKYREAVSVYQAVVSAGMHTEDHESTRTDYPSSSFGDGLGDEVISTVVRRRK